VELVDLVFVEGVLNMVLKLGSVPNVDVLEFFCRTGLSASEYSERHVSERMSRLSERSSAIMVLPGFPPCISRMDPM